MTAVKRVYGIDRTVKGRPPTWHALLKKKGSVTCSHTSYTCRGRSLRLQSPMLARRGSKKLWELAIGHRLFHASSPVRETHKQRVARLNKEKNLAGKARRAEQVLITRPHPVLGHPISDDSSWRNCHLAKIIINREQLEEAPHLPTAFTEWDQQPQVTRHQSFGIGENEKHLLFEKLPDVTALAAYRATTRATTGRDKDPTHHRQGSADQGEDQKHQYQVAYIEQHKRLILARLTDLRNANAEDLAFENRRRIVEAFSPPHQQRDTGRPEVQAALMTMKIRNLWTHLSSSKKDVTNVRHLRRLVHQRAKMLKYLKRLDFQRFELCLDQLAIAPEAIEGEIIVNPL